MIQTIKFIFSRRDAWKAKRSQYTKNSNSEFFLQAPCKTPRFAAAEIIIAINLEAHAFFFWSKFRGARAKFFHHTQGNLTWGWSIIIMCFVAQTYDNNNFRLTISSRRKHREARGPAQWGERNEANNGRRMKWHGHGTRRQAHSFASTHAAPQERTAHTLNDFKRSFIHPGTNPDQQRNTQRI